VSSWKHSLQVRDLAPNQRLEITCKRCGHVHYLSREMILTTRARENLTLAEVEAQTRCKARGCKGAVRMAMVREGPASGFVGGMA
jgi:uncharacterized OB-fold protein